MGVNIFELVGCNYPFGVSPSPWRGKYSVILRLQPKNRRVKQVKCQALAILRSVLDDEGKFLGHLIT